MSSRQTHYNMHASKGFSYLVPTTVQGTLNKMLKQLPFATRSIYREYYGDIMASRACALDSSRAMTEFVTNSFPTIMPYHNRLAKLMNAEIMLDEHDGYIPTLFPLIGDGSDELESQEVAGAPQTKKTQALASHNAVDDQQQTAQDFGSGSPTSSLSLASMSPVAQCENDDLHSASAESSKDAMNIDDAISASSQSSHKQNITPPTQGLGTVGTLCPDPTSEEESEEEVHTPATKKRRATTPPNAYNVRRKTIKVSHLMSPGTWSSPESLSTLAQEVDKDEIEDFDRSASEEGSGNVVDVVQDGVE